MSMLSGLFGACRTWNAWLRAHNKPQLSSIFEFVEAGFTYVDKGPSTGVVRGKIDGRVVEIVGDGVYMFSPAYRSVIEWRKYPFTWHNQPVVGERIVVDDPGFCGSVEGLEDFIPDRVKDQRCPDCRTYVCVCSDTPQGNPFAGVDPLAITREIARGS